MVRPQPAEVKGKAGEVVPGANTVEDMAGEFNHPMFSLTSGVYDGQVLYRNKKLFNMLTYY